MKITLAIPTNRLIKPQTAECLMRLVARGGYDFHIVVASEGYTIAENRTYLAVQGVEPVAEFDDLFSHRH